MLSAIIPDARRDAVDLALREVFGCAQIQGATPLKDGFSGALVTCVEAGGRKALLRVETARDALRDPLRQYACMRIAAEAGVAPALRYADAEAGVAVMDFIEARPLAEYPGGGQLAALELARLTRRLRATSVFPGLMEQVDGVDQVLGGVLASGLCAPEAVASHLAAWRTLRDAYPRTTPQQRVSSHNDLNPNNVLYDGRRLWLVDWESAFANDPLVDPVSISFWYGVAGEAEEALLAAAFEAVDDRLRARFFMMRLVAQVFNGALMLMLAGRGRAPGAPPIDDFSAPPFAEVRGGLARRSVDLATGEGRLLFGKACLNAARDAVDGPGFEAAVRAAA